MSRAALPDVLCLAGILALAAVLRLWHVEQPLNDAFSWRQASTAMMADNFRTGGWNILYPEVSWTGPGPGYQGREFQVLSYITALIDAAFGWRDWTGRMVAAGFGLVTVFALHRMAALVWDERHAHAVALSYALMPGAVMIDSSVIPEPAMLALVTLGLWLFLKQGAEGGRGVLLLLGAAAFTLGCLAKLPGLAAGFAVLWMIVIWLLRGERRHALGALALGLAGLAAIAAYYGWAIRLGQSYPPFHVAGSGYLWDWGLAAFLERRFFLADLWKISVWWFYGYPMIALALVGLWFAPSGRGPGHDAALSAVPGVWLVGGAVLFLVGAREITSNPWNLHVLHVPVAFFAGRGAIVLAEAGGVRLASATGLLRLGAVFALVAFWSTQPLLESMKRPVADAGRLLGERLALLRAPDDLVIAIAPQAGDPVAIHYSRGRGWVFPPGGGEADWSTFVADDRTAIAQLEALRAQGARWFGVTRNASDRQRRLFLEHHAGVIAHLDRTATLVGNTDDFLIYRLTSAE